MAFNDTLFQLGMDLTRSSTAQTEEFSRSQSVTDMDTEHTSDASAELALDTRDTGHTLFIDLHGATRFADLASVKAAVSHAVERLGLALQSLHIDWLGDNMSGVAVFGDGHVSLHACGRTGITAVDARGCVGLKPESALMAFADAFGAREAVLKTARRAQYGVSKALPSIASVPLQARAQATAQAA